MFKEYSKKDFLKFGNNTFLSKSVEIRRPQFVSIGKNCAIDTGFYCTTKAKIGDYIHIGPYVTIIGGLKSKIIINDFATIAAGTRLICGSDAHTDKGLSGPTIPNEYRDEVTYTTIKIERCANIATNCVVMPGITIGEGSVIGPNSLITKNTNPWTIYLGSPARAIKIRDKKTILAFAKKLKNKFT